MNESSQLADTSSCPDRHELVDFGAGRLPIDQSETISWHLESCTRCESTLHALEENSDTLLQVLASLPSVGDDEPEYRRAHEALLDNPEPFTGTGLPHDPSTWTGGDVSAPELLPRRMGGYELLERIGQGATGCVYRARHLKLDRDVAVKVLTSQRIGGAESVQRFFKEMKAVGKLDHPHIIRATDAGEAEGFHYLVMEYVEGVDASSLVSALGPLPVPEACELIRQAALGLEFAHQHGMVHRDVKPSNLLFTFHGQVKLLDLGLVSAKDEQSADETDAPDGIARGTADYMSPEQWTDFRNVDIRADVYSLGCTFYKLLTGYPPYGDPEGKKQAGAREKMEAHLHAPVPTLRQARPDVPAALERIMGRLLAKDRADRFDRPADVASALQGFARRAHLRELVIQVKGNSADVAVVDAAGTSSLPRRVSRRTVLGTIAAAAAVAGIAWWAFPFASPSVHSEQWRDLQPMKPTLLTRRAAQGVEWSHDVAQQITRVSSNDLCLIHLGRPVLGQFTVRTTLNQEEWDGGAGIFFKFRSQHGEDRPSHSFQTIEVHRSQSAPGAPYRLVWRTFSLRVSLDGLVVEPDEWAEAPIDVNTAAAGHTLQVTLGRTGFPQVFWDGRLLHKSEWVLSTVARDQSSISRGRVGQAYLGRLGLVNWTGTTTFSKTQLMYH